ncbi:MAG: zf-HC2 domain-containing protein [Clostridia bacterium]
MKTLECDIIQDLLPSYSDKISSKATNKLVEEHLKQCENCKIVLENMNKEIDTSYSDNQDEKIDYLKRYKKKRKALIIFSIVLTISILLIIFAFNVFNKNILLDRLVYVDVDKFNVDYMYIKENEGRNETTGETFKYKTLQVYLYSDEYKYMYLTGGYELESGENEIFYNIAAKQLPKGVEFDSSGLEMSFMIDDNIEKIFIKDTKNNLKEIWNRDMEIQSEEEWKKWYIDSYVPKEIIELYNMSYENISVHTSVWKNLYNKNSEDPNVKVWRITE